MSSKWMSAVRDSSARRRSDEVEFHNALFTLAWKIFPSTIKVRFAAARHNNSLSDSSCDSICSLFQRMIMLSTMETLYSSQKRRRRSNSKNVSFRRSRYSLAKLLGSDWWVNARRIKAIPFHLVDLVDNFDSWKISCVSKTPGAALTTFLRFLKEKLKKFGNILWVLALSFARSSS